MTRVELVRLVGDVLRQLDLKKARSADLSRVVPTEVRNALAKQQLKIAITELDESTPTFFKASEEILAIDARLRGTAESNCVALVDSLRSLVKTLDGLVTSGN